MTKHLKLFRYTLLCAESIKLFIFDFITAIVPVNMLTYTGLDNNITEKSGVRPMTRNSLS